MVPQLAALLICGSVFLLLLVLSILLISGRGAFLISGYNMLPKAEKEKYNEKALCRFAGRLLLVIDFLLVFTIIAGIYEINWLTISLIALIIIYTLGSIIYANTNNRFKIKN